MFEIILLILCVLLPVLWFFAVPLVIYQTHRMDAAPEIARVDNEPDLPEPVRRYFFDVYESLTSLGFAHEGTFYMPQPAPNLRCIVNAYVHRADRSSGLAVAVYVKTATSWTLQAAFVGFETRFADQTTIESSNQPSVGAFPKPEGSRLWVHPDLQNPAALYQAHQLTVAAHAAGRRPINALDDKFHGNAIAMLAEDVRSELEGAARLGYMKPPQGDAPTRSSTSSVSGPSATSPSATHSSTTHPSGAPSPYDPPAVEQGASTSYRPTLKGAYLMTWKETWPLKSIILWFRTRADRRSIEQAGFRAVS